MSRKSVEQGDRVSVHFTGRAEDENVFASSREGNPIEFEVGAGEVITGLDNGVVGMEEGQQENLVVHPQEAFGDPRGDLVTTIMRTDFPETLVPQEGKLLRVKTGEGQIVSARITRIEGDEVTIDANHPLAGQTIQLDVEMVAIQKA
jgi:FKBP-type peptidyl-prolyl cis-trans isomerase 2